MIGRLFSSRLTRLLIVAIVPAVVLGVFIGALAAADAGTARVPAALVNQDQLVQQKGTDGKTTTIAAGRLLTSGLTKPADSGSGLGVDWRLTNASDAKRMLDAGDVYAVVTIPKGFSKSISTLSTTDPRRAEIRIATDDAHGTLVSQLGGLVGDTIASTIGGQISTNVVQGLYGGYATVRSSLGTAADGADELGDGATSLSTGLVKAADGGTKLSSGVRSLGSGADGLASGASSLAAGLDRASSGASSAAAGAKRFAGGVDDYTDGVTGYTKGVDRFLTGVAPAFSPSAAAGQQQLADGSGKIAAALKQLAAAPGTSAQQAQTLGALATQLGQVSAGQAKLAAGAKQLSKASAAISGLRSGGARLASGGTTLDRGASSFASGLTKLPAGISSAASGARKLGSGASQLASGAGSLATGVAQLSTGVRRSATGASQLATGATKLGTGLRSGAEQVPDLSAAQQKRVGEVVADPVSATATRENELSSAGAVVATLIVPVALWIGAAALVLLFGAVRRRLLVTGVGTGRLVGGTVARGAVVALVQSAVMTALLAVTLKPEWPAVIAVFGIALVASVAFLTIHQLLQTVFGRAGTVLSIVLLGVQLVAAGGIYPIELVSAPFQAISPFLPLTAAVTAVQSALAGAGGGAVAGGVLSLLLWGVLVFVLTVVVIARRRGSAQLFSAPGAAAFS